MEELNYHHLYYFWRVVRAGSIAQACKEMNLSPPTVSTQVRQLEKTLGEELFTRSGRRMTLTEGGRVAFRYADSIFALGREFVDVLRGRSQSTSLEWAVGVNDVLPKPIVYRLIEPVFRLPEPVRVRCIQGTPAQLLPPLAVHELDMVISDAPPGPDIHVRAFSHLLGECPITILAVPELARKLRTGFPRSLDDAPALLPAPGSALRIALDQWFESARIRPRVVGDFEDISLLSVCGQHGRGFFAGHSVVEKDLMRTHGVERVGRVPRYRAQFYAITVERRLTQPAMLAITEAARRTVFR